MSHQLGSATWILLFPLDSIKGYIFTYTVCYIDIWFQGLHVHLDSLLNIGSPWQSSMKKRIQTMLSEVWTQLSVWEYMVPTTGLALHLQGVCYISLSSLDFMDICFTLCLIILQNDILSRSQSLLYARALNPLGKFWKTLSHSNSRSRLRMRIMWLRFYLIGEGKMTLVLPNWWGQNERENHFLSLSLSDLHSLYCWGPCVRCLFFWSLISI